MDPQYLNQIKTEFSDCVERTIERLQRAETSAPFHEALLTPEGRAWSRFERSFSTSLGQGAIERVSRLVALSGGAADVLLQRETTCVLDTGVSSSIDSHIDSIRDNTLGRPPNWGLDLDSVLNSRQSGRTAEFRVISDLWFRREGVDHFVSIKTVQPNLDQTAQAKRDLLRIKAHDQHSKVYFGLYYNPYGDHRRDYSHSFPRKVFDMATDPVVLIGRDYWELLGGPGAMEEVLTAARSVGDHTRRMISAWAGTDKNP